jgi:LysM repeat protein
LVTLSTIVVGLILLLPSTGEAVDGIEVTSVHTVQAGDSLWEIARSIAPESSDLRVTVGEIRELNGLVTSIIVPGQELLIPTPSG